MKKRIPPHYLSQSGPGAAVTRGCTGRAVALGLFASACMALAIPYGDMVIKGSRLGIWNINPGAIFIFFVIVAVVNTGLGLIARRWALDRSELAVVYVMLLIANALPARGFSGLVAPIATGAFYYASDMNNWAELLHSHLPEWATVQDADAVRRFYEGDPIDPHIPWDAWLTPLVAWLVFGLALYLVMVSLAVVLRKQWVDNERLTYPMVQLPLHMLRDDDQGSALRPFFKQPAMWVGFAVPFLINNFNALNHYVPAWPELSTNFGHISGFGGLVNVQVYLSMTVLGFSYFISKSVGAGLCLFYLLNGAEQGVLSIMGAKMQADAVGAFGHYAAPVIMHQAMGAMIALVLIGLWKARTHLGDVCRNAFTGRGTTDDSGEIMSYRQAVFSGLAGLLVMAVWLWRAGVPPLVIPVLLFGCFVVFLTITRVVVEGGVAAMFPPMVGPDFVASGLGTSVLGARGGAGLATTYVWGTDVLVLLMASCSNGLRLADRVGPRARRLFWAIMATIVVTIALSLWLRLSAGYTYGTINLNHFYAFHSARYPYQFMEKVVTSPVGPNLWGWVQMGAGALIMLALEVVHLRFLWWPFHPLGFPISAAFGSMWFSVFFALVIKTAVLAYGGANLYRRLMPVFLGLILGEVVSAGAWLIVDYFTGTQGNTLGTFMS